MGTATGKILKIFPTKAGGHMLLYDIHCTAGNSGSCVMVTDERFVKKVSKDPNVKKVVVAVHLGSDIDCNFGTLTTKLVWDWIGEHYAIYSCNALSSKTKTI